MRGTEGNLQPLALKRGDDDCRLSSHSSCCGEVYRQDVPRIYELRDLAPDQASPDFCLRNLDQLLGCR
jgi:hypothetical protein